MIKLANLREKQIRNCFESYVVVPPISAIAEEHSAAPAGSGSGRGGTRRDFSPAESAFHRQVSAQRCLKSSPDSFFFFYNACISVPTAVGKADQLTDPKENKPSKTPEG